MTSAVERRHSSIARMTVSLADWAVEKKLVAQGSAQDPVLMNLLALESGAECLTQMSMFHSHVTQGHFLPNSQGDIKIGNNICKAQNML